jgi:hypothetical protein
MSIETSANISNDSMDLIDGPVLSESDEVNTLGIHSVSEQNRDDAAQLDTNNFIAILTSDSEDSKTSSLPNPRKTLTQSTKKKSQYIEVISIPSSGSESCSSNGNVSNELDVKQEPVSNIVLEEQCKYKQYMPSNSSIQLENVPKLDIGKSQSPTPPSPIVKQEHLADPCHLPSLPLEEEHNCSAVEADSENSGEECNSPSYLVSKRIDKKISRSSASDSGGSLIFPSHIKFKNTKPGPHGTKDTQNLPQKRACDEISKKPNDPKGESAASSGRICLKISLFLL